MKTARKALARPSSFPYHAEPVSLRRGYLLLAGLFACGVLLGFAIAWWAL